jgi:hypothetical protein
MPPETPHEALPCQLVDLLGGQPGPDSTEQAFPFLTTDPEGFPHVALLSRAEIEVTPDHRRLVAAIASRRTAANLRRTSRATLIAIGGTTAHYLKLSVSHQYEEPGILGCELTPTDLVADSLGIALSPILFRTSAELSQTEQWARSARLLSLLSTREH